MPAATHWIAGFRSAVISPDDQVKFAEPRGFAEETVRQMLHMAGGGEQIRLRLSNRYGHAPLTVGEARVALRKSGNEIIAETDHRLTFDGAAQVTIPVGAEVVSDPVALAVAPGADLAVSLYLPQDTGLATYSGQPGEIGFVAAGNVTSASGLPDAAELAIRVFITGVDVLAPVGIPVAVAFGDSWFEGVSSTPGTNRRSVDVINERLDRGWVVNQGISGNRLGKPEVGESGLDRWERDVLSVPGVTSVLVNFGINDLILVGMTGESPATAAELIANYTELARRAHEAGLTIHAATIGPYARCIYEGLPVAETLPIRRQVNDWLRTTDVVDSVFDVARAVEDPARPDYIRPDFDDDGMHLNDAGHRAMGESIDVTTIFG